MHFETPAAKVGRLAAEEYHRHAGRHEENRLGPAAGSRDMAAGRRSGLEWWNPRIAGRAEIGGSLADILIERGSPTAEHVLAIVLDGLQIPGRHPRHPLVVGDDFADLPRQRRRIVRTDHVLRREQLGNPAHGRTDARQPAGHGLDHCPRQTFLPRRKHKQIGAVQFLPDGFPGRELATETDAIAQAQRRRLRFQLGPMFSVSHDRQPQIEPIPRALSDGVDQNVRRLVQVSQPADHAPNRTATGRPRGRGCSAISPSIWTSE